MATSGIDLSAFFDCGKPFEEYGGRDAQIRVIPVVRLNRQNDENGIYVNTTSTGDDAERTLSPFRLGPCQLYGSYKARRMENAWQFSKVYSQHVENGRPTAEYFEWAEQGWASQAAQRHPMGKEMNGKEAFHWWDGQPVDKVQARKRIYVPLYAERVIEQQFFKDLKGIWEENRKHQEFTLYLMDFDAYEYGTMSFSQVLNNPKSSMGHGFVVAMLLTDDPALKQCELR